MARTNVLNKLRNDSSTGASSSGASVQKTTTRTRTNVLNKLTSTGLARRNKYGIDDDVWSNVQRYSDTIGDYNWRSKYEYDLLDAEDMRRKSQGLIPYALEKRYDLEDDLDRALYYEGLPSSKDLASVAEAAQKASVKAAQEQREREESRAKYEKETAQKQQLTASQNTFQRLYQAAYNNDKKTYDSLEDEISALKKLEEKAAKDPDSAEYKLYNHLAGVLEKAEAKNKQDSMQRQSNAESVQAHQQQLDDKRELYNQQIGAANTSRNELVRQRDVIDEQIDYIVSRPYGIDESSAKELESLRQQRARLDAQLKAADQQTHSLQQQRAALSASPDIARIAEFLNDEYAEAGLQTGYYPRAQYTKYLSMSTDERERFYSILEAKGENAAMAYIESIDSELNARDAAQTAAWHKEFTENVPVAADLVSVMMTPLKATGAAYAVFAGENADTNSPWLRAGTVQSAIRDTRSEQLGDIGGFLYNTGMSMLDTMLTSKVGGKASLGIMGAGAMADTYQNALERGANPGQALAVGTLAGVSEALFEKVSLDRWVKLGSVGRGAALKNILKTAGIEASEEMSTEVANVISDLLIMGELGETHGKSFGEVMGQIGLAGLGGLFSGAGFGVLNHLANRANSRAQAAAQQAAANDQQAENTADVGDLGAERVDTANDGQIQAKELIAQAADIRANLAAGAYNDPEEAREASEAARELEELAESLNRWEQYQREYNAYRAAEATRGDAPETDAETPERQEKATAEKPIQPRASVPVTPGLTRNATPRALNEAVRKLAESSGKGVNDKTMAEASSAINSQLRAIDALGKRYGIEIELRDNIEAIDGEGNAVESALSGYYDPQTRRIIIAADATDQAYTFVATHELVHYIKDSGMESYSTLESTVFEALEAAGEDVEALVRQQMEQQGYDEFSAREEVVANSVPAILTDEATVKRIVETDRTLGERIAEFFKGFAENLRSIFRSLAKRPGWTQMESISKQADSMEKISNAFFAALEKSAVAGFLESGTGDVKASPRLPADFGDSQDIAANFRTVANMEPVAELTGNEFPKGEKSLLNQVAEFFESVGGSVEHPELGTIRLTKSGVRNDIRHGIGNKKAVAFAAVPEVLRNGKVLEYQYDWKGRGYDSVTVGAPISIAGEPHYIGAVLLKTRGDDVFYLHEVATENTPLFKTGAGDSAWLTSKDVSSAEGASPFTTRPDNTSRDTSDDAPSVTSILQKVFDYKGESQQETGTSVGNVKPSTKEGSPIKGGEAYVDTNQASPREILAGALEGIAQNAREQKFLESYKEVIGSLNKTQAKYDEASARLKKLRKENRELLFAGKLTDERRDAAKSLESYVDKLGKGLDQYDKRLLNLEAAAPLKDVVSRERTRISREKAQQFRDWKIENRENAEMQGYKTRIEANAKTLYSRVLNPNSSAYVPKGFVRAVSEFLATLDFTGGKAIDVKARGEAKANGIEYTRNQQIEHWSKKLSALDDLIKGLSADTSLDMQFEQKLSERIDKLLEDASGVLIVADMNLEQLKMLDGVVSDIKRTIIDATRGARVYKDRISRNVKELLNRMISPTEKGNKYVPEEFQNDVIEVLRSIRFTSDANVDTALATRKRNLDEVLIPQARQQYEELVAKNAPQQDIEKAFNKLQRYLVETENVRNEASKWRSKLQALLTSIGDVEVEKGEAVQIESDTIQGIRDLLKETGDVLTLDEMTAQQLQKLDKIVRALKHAIVEANRIEVNGKKQALSDMGQSVITEAQESGKQGKKRTGLGKLLNWSNIKPVYAFKRMGGTLYKLFNDIANGQRTYALNMDKAHKYYEKQYKDFHVSDWINDKEKLKFTTKRGDTIELSRNEALSLYATHKREMANPDKNARHLSIGGFVFEAEQTREKTKVVENGKEKTIKKTTFTDATPKPLTEADMKVIEGWLTKEQMAFADELVNYMSTTLADLGNETSLKQSGFKKFGESYYFPYKSSPDYIARNPGEGVRDNERWRHKGFTKSTVAGARNPIVLQDFTKVFGQHVNDMLMYHAMAIPQENLLRVFNWHDKYSEDETSMSVSTALTNAYGPEAVKYINNFLADLNGGLMTDPRESDVTRQISRFKKGVTMASLSVIVQQPSALVRAMAPVHIKYFGAMPKKGSYKQAMQYSGTAVIKRMGGFDTGTGVGAAGYVTGVAPKGAGNKAREFVSKDSAYRDEVLGAAPQKMDEFAWSWIWEAVKKETAAKMGIKPGDGRYAGEEHLQAAGRRFDEVIEQTQVYDSVISRSELMRSQSGLLKMVTAFGAEPTVAYNMFYDAVTSRNVKHAGAYIGAIVASGAVNALLKSFVTAARDDDEEKGYWEKYGEALKDEILGQPLNRIPFTDIVLEDEKLRPLSIINPLTMVPVVRDVISMFQGYDVERTDMSLFDDLITAIDNLDSDRKNDYQKWRDLGGSIANITGIPIKNVMRDIEAVLRVFKVEIGG